MDNFDKHTINLTKYFDTKEDALEELRNTATTMCDGWWTIPKEVADLVSPMASLLYSMLLGYANGLYRGSNNQLAQQLNCSTRTLSRLIEELEVKRCIKIVIVNRTTRLIYPLYTLPFILDIDNKKYSEKKTLQEPKKELPSDVKDFLAELKKHSQR